jgi:tetratricopeptide (TPR) repeat protein
VNHALSPDGRLLALTTEEGTCALVDPATGAELAVLPPNLTIPLRFETSGALLTYGSAGLRRWPVARDPASGACRFGPPELLFRGVSNHKHGSSLNGRIVAIPNLNRGALLLNRDRPGPPLVLGPQQDTRRCAVSPDGRWVATGNHFNSQGIGAKVWDASTGKLVKDLRLHGSCWVAFSPDGKWLLTAAGGCRLWAVGTWEKGPFLGKVSTDQLAFSSDGRVLALLDEAGSIGLVEPATGREYVRLDAPTDVGVFPMCFSPDGARLFALGSEGKAVHVWDLRRIRRGLAELGLDWDAPPYPKPAAVEGPLKVAVRLDPKDPEPHLRLGWALFRQDKWAQAEKAFRQAVRLAPGNATARYSLGAALGRQGKVEQAGAAYREAIRLDPALAEAHCNLGGVLRSQGRLAESLQSYRRGHALGLKRPGWGYPSAEWVRRGEQLVLLEKRLPDVLAGKHTPASPRERADYAQVCALTGRHAAAARLYAEAFAADAKLAEDLSEGHRYNAACAAALAAAGKGEGAAKLDDKERTRLRRQALGWLKADLAAWAKVAEGPAGQRLRVQKTLTHWRADADLAGVRDEAALEKLPKAEATSWRKLWADVVDALLKRSTKPGRKEGSDE